MSIIAIDCGASFIKAAIMKNDVIEKTIIEPTPKANGSESRISKTVNLVRNMIKSLSNGISMKIGFSTEMHGFLLEKNNKLLTDYISWQNEYNDRDYLEYYKSLVDEKNIEVSGMPMKAGLPSVNLCGFLRDGIISNESSVNFYTLGDYIIKEISGINPYTHITNAAATGLYDLTEKQWNIKLLKDIKADKIKFPKVGNKSIKFRMNGVEYEAFPAIGDQQAALYGSGFKGENQVSLNFGTGAQVSVLTDCLEFSNKYQIRPFFNEKYIKTIPHIPSGRALNVFFNLIKETIINFKEIDDDSIWNYIINETINNKKELMEIDMSFFSNPITSNNKASIMMIGEYDFTIGNLFDSIYHKMAENAYLMFKKLNNNKVDTIVFSGGVVRKNQYLRSLMENKFDFIQSTIVSENETLKGIALYVSDEERL